MTDRANMFERVPKGAAWYCRTCGQPVRFTYPAPSRVEVVNDADGTPHTRCSPTPAVAARVDAQRERQRQLAQEAARAMAEGDAQSWVGAAAKVEGKVMDHATGPGKPDGGGAGVARVEGHPPAPSPSPGHHPDGLPKLDRCPHHTVPYLYDCHECQVANLNGWTGDPEPPAFVPDFEPVRPLAPRLEQLAAQPFIPDELAARRAAKAEAEELAGLEQGQALAQEGMDRAAAHAPYGWNEAALDAIHVVARCQAELTTDDVWREVGKPPEPRAMGAVMQAAARAGIIEKTDRVRPSSRPETHANPKAVWRSLTYEQETPTCR